MAKLTVWAVDDLYLFHPDELKHIEVLRTTLEILPHNKDGYVRIATKEHIYAVRVDELLELIGKNSKPLPKAPAHGDE